MLCLLRKDRSDEMKSYRKELWFDIPKIFYGEFDGMRRKRVLVKIIGE